jgi:hypothetical protein
LGDYITVYLTVITQKQKNIFSTLSALAECKKLPATKNAQESIKKTGLLFGIGSGLRSGLCSGSGSGLLSKKSICLICLICLVLLSFA